MAGNAYAGVRPLPQKDKGPESAITRKHIIRRNSEIAGNLLSIIGGKLTTYRHLSEQAVDAVGKILRRRLPECRTHDTPLPGGWGFAEAQEALQAIPGLSAAGVERIAGIYGGRAAGIAELARQAPEMARTLDSDSTVLAAEVVFALREELARTLADVVFRRTMLGLAPDQGRSVYEDIAQIAAAELGWDAARAGDELQKLRHYADSFLPGE